MTNLLIFQMYIITVQRIVVIMNTLSMCVGSVVTTFIATSTCHMLQNILLLGDIMSFAARRRVVIHHEVASQKYPSHHDSIIGIFYYLFALIHV